MAKINSVVRIIEFNSERELYIKIQDDLTSYLDEPDSRCYKLKNIQMIDDTHVLAYFEEDLNSIMVKFFFNGEEVYVEEAPDQIQYYSIQEISLVNELGLIKINDKEYDVEEVRYVVNDYGVRYAEIHLD
jgi:hypothetical protein